MKNQISYNTLEVEENIQFDIATWIKYLDPISQSIVDQTFSFSSTFHLAFRLLQPGHTVIDLGAHIGTFSLAAAALGCKVLAVEASPHNVDLLKAGVVRNGFNHIQVVHAAVSDRPGTLEFVQGGPFGYVANPVLPASNIQVPAVTVDELLAQVGWDRVDFIKMDVEGSEVSAIRGMSRLLTRPDAPPIIYESNGHVLRFFDKTPNDLIAALEQFGYRNYLIEPEQLVPVRSSDIQPECNVDYLATKQPPQDLEDWSVVSPMTSEEIVSKILLSCTHMHEHYRAYIARALAGANPAILSDQRVVNALDTLYTDHNTDVRAGVSWFDRNLATFTNSLGAQPDVMLREYKVRSQVPVIGGLIAWVRRNLTSHLRGPYLDPTFERQVVFNRRLVQEIRNIAITQAEIRRRLARLEAQLNQEHIPDAENTNC